MEGWMLLALVFLLVGVGGILTGVRLSKGSEKSLQAARRRGRTRRRERSSARRE